MSNGLIPADLIVVAVVLLSWWSIEAWRRMRAQKRARRILDRRPAAWR